jgi:hypothetical protein
LGEKPIIQVRAGSGAGEEDEPPPQAQTLAARTGASIQVRANNRRMSPPRRRLTAAMRPPVPPARSRDERKKPDSFAHAAECHWIPAFARRQRAVLQAPYCRPYPSIRISMGSMTDASLRTKAAAHEPIDEVEVLPTGEDTGHAGETLDDDLAWCDEEIATAGAHAARTAELLKTIGLMIAVLIAIFAVAQMLR